MYETLLNLCKSKNISITNLCLEITGSRGNLNTWKKGNINPTSLIKIADYFEVSTDYLLGRTDNPSGYNNINNSYNQNGNHNFQTVGSMKEISKRDAEILQKINSLDFKDYVNVINYINKIIENKE